MAAVVVASDASDENWGGFIDTGAGRRRIARGAFTAVEQGLSSTGRELTGQLRTLSVFEKLALETLRLVDAGLRTSGGGLATRRVVLYCDNQSAVRILTIGSKKPVLQRIVREIFHWALKHSVVLVPRWKRRSTQLAQLCDDIGKIDDCDYSLDAREFEWLAGAWGRPSLDCFASEANAVVDAFFAWFDCKGCAGVDALAHDWSRDPRGRSSARPRCWIHPPRAKVAVALRHMQRCGARGVVLVPLDRSELWWPLVAPGCRGAVTVGGVERRCAFRRRRGLLWSGGRPLKAGYRDLLAVQLDFSPCNVNRLCGGSVSGRSISVGTRSRCGADGW
jgi:hypothetical protein